MKQLIKRSTSVLLAILMFASFVLVSVTAVITQAEPAASDPGTAPDIDFDYADKYGITTAEQAKAQLADSKIVEADGTAEATALYKQISDNYKWKHVGRRQVFFDSADDKLNEFKDFGTPYTDKGYKEYVKLWCRYENRVGYHVRDTAFNELAPALESTAEGDKNIVLDTDFTFNNLYYLPGTIKITSPKVLDLNGHSIYLNDITNRAFRDSRQNDHEYAHSSRMFEITGNGSLTIIDSSEIVNDKDKGTGAIYTNNYMTDPFGNEYNYYTSRDIFWVDGGGKLIIYSGTYQAGRSKDQREDAFTWDNVKKVIGSAVELGVNVSEYAFGIKGAKAALTDLQESFAKGEVEQVAEADGANITGASPKSTGGSTVKKDGANGVKEIKEDNPVGALMRNKAVGEKAKGKNDAIKKENKDNGTEKPTEPDNKANDKNSAKEENAEGKKAEGKKDGKNVQLVNAEKKIVDAALDKSKIGTMVDEAFDLVDDIIGLFGSKGPRLTQSTLGTVAHVGNNGTFVSYGGHYIGFGSTPNTRNAVIEVTEQLGVPNKNFSADYDRKFLGGLVYVYGGNFDAHTGANIFNIVSKNTSAIKGHYQTTKDSSGKAVKEPATIKAFEIYGGEPVSLYNDKPVDTRNIAIRGGNFNCSTELTMAGLWEDGKITMFPGTKGFMNLGIESYNPDYIKDGRIQIRDTYGDGELVLMDEAKDENEKLHHYRLFCSELELRYNSNLQVYPGNSEANTTHSFYLVSTNGETANGEMVELSKSWSGDEEGSERNSAYGDTEQYFEFPVNPEGLTERSNSGKYYITPSTSRASSDVYGDKFAGSSLWYYSVPLDHNGVAIDSDFEYSNLFKHDLVYVDSGASAEGDISERSDPDHYYADLNDSRYKVLSKNAYSSNFSVSSKWFHYKVYRVDPLTRENIDEGSKYGDKVPLADIVYGGSNDSLNCKLTLVKLEQYLKKKWGDSKDRYGNYHFRGFRPGEMYRVVFTVDESIAYNPKLKEAGFTNDLDTASMTSSILFTCYDDETEKKVNPADSKGAKIPDYTPLQWAKTPEAGQTAEVNIVNGKAGQTDYLGRKIFDIYYQWYTVDSNGKETLIAGTDDIYTGGDPNELKNHTLSGINEETANTPSGYQYKNTIDPKKSNAKDFDENGMPKNKKEWLNSDFHAYSEWFMGDLIKNRELFNDTTPDGTGAHGLKDNYPYIFNTSSDSCYIPKSAAGKAVYCKAYAVNTYWPLNYDHVQVFKSHKVNIPAVECTVAVETDGGYDEYIVESGGKFTLPEGFADPTVGSTKEFDSWTLGKPGDVITVYSDMRINAVWKQKTVDNTPKVSFTAGDGSGTMADENVSKLGALYKFPDSTFTPPTDKAFIKWYITDSLGNYVGEYYPGDVVKVNKALCCEAQYHDRFYVYVAEHIGDEENVDKNRSRYKGMVSVNGKFTLPELYWDYYNGKYADSWTLGKPGETVTITSNIISRYADGRFLYIYPDYRDPGEFVVTYDANGGEFKEEYGGGSTYAVSVMEFDSKGERRLITDDTLYRDGYEFLGWKIDGSAATLAPAEKFKVTANMTIKAQWKQIPPPAPNWHSEFDRATGTLTIVGTGVISQSDGSYLTGIGDDVDTYDLKHLVFSEGITEISKPICGNEFKTVKFPSTLEKIGAYAFGPQSGSLPWVKEIDIPASVKTIGPYAFCMNASFEKVTLHEGLEEIAKNAFSGCDGLTEITVPDSVKRLGRFAFGSEGNRYFCDRQEVIPHLIVSQADRFYDGFVIKCSKDSLAQEYAIKYGFNYDNGESKPAPVTNDKIKYTVDTKTKTITVTGTGPIPDYNYYNAPWSREKADEYCRKLIIGEGITSIGKYAFAGMCITEVQFPSTLKKIDDYAFLGCDVLGCKDGITFPDSLESIGTAAFRYVGAKTINFGSGVKSIGAYAFCDRKVYRIETIYPDGYDPYDGVTGVAYAYEVEIPDNVQTIGDYAFGYYNTYDMDWRVSPFTLEAPLSNLGGKDESGKIKNLTIVTPKGSAAYSYAKANGFNATTKGVVNYICVGDVNYDGVVNDTDLSRFDHYFSSYIGLGIPSYNLKEETADINRDGSIDETDFNLLRSCLEDADLYSIYINPIRVIQ